MDLDGLIREYTKTIDKKGLLRKRIVSSGRDSKGIFFDSNDYLSLSLHPQLSKAYQKGYQLYPSGSGGSMMLNGYHANHQLFEKAMAQWLEVDACILYSSGYAANLAITSLLGQLKASCLIDKGVHASIYDGLKLAKVPYTRYLHQDLKDASEKLKGEPDVMITEGIFSMSGQMPPLDELARLSHKHHTRLLVDEAHSVGLVGKEGRGAVNHHSLTQKEVPLRVIPLGKAFAGQGAIIAGKADWIEALLQASRSLIYSTAVSPALSYGLLHALELLIGAEERRNKLKQLIAHFRACIKNSSLSFMDSQTPIQQVQLGCPYLALSYTQQLQKKGIYCSAIRQPTVSLKASGLRILLNYHHNPEDINLLFQELAFVHDNSSY